MPPTRRDLLKLAAGTGAAHLLATSLRAAAPPGALAPFALEPLPLGAIKPAGWLRHQLQIQADGLSGHLDELWPDLGLNSGWLGGTGEAWERGPYFLDGLIPLAWQLNDARLQAKALRWINWTLDHQQPTGMIGPAGNHDWWPRMVMVKALAQFHDATADPRVLPVLTRYFHYQLAALPTRPITSWGRYRWQDEAFVVEWLFDRTNDPRLLDLIALLRRQGYDWPAGFADFHYTTPTPHSVLDPGNDEYAMQTHGVNNSQALKTSAVLHRLTGDPADHAALLRQLTTLDRFHGVPNGMFTCDEHLAGLEPSHGTALCSVVETMFSLEVALAVFGDLTLADRLERIAYNALPGAFTDDMWAHQYDQQSNQIQVGLLTRPWTTNGPESNLFGLEPHFGCCTANFHQGWPKFTASLWSRTPASAPGAADDGLAATLYAPCEVHTVVRGTPIHLAVATGYPFRETVRVTVTPARPLRLSLSLRIPGWAAGASVDLNGRRLTAAVTPGTFVRLDRLWHPGDFLELTLPMPPRLSRWVHNSVALERGPLVFSLSPGESWVKLRTHNPGDPVQPILASRLEHPPITDWQVFPTAAWNYALAVDERTAPTLRVVESPVGPRPFARGEGAPSTPVRIEVPGHRLEAWRSEDGVALPPPQSPVRSSAPAETLTFIPYAAAKLRITAFPQQGAKPS